MFVPLNFPNHINNINNFTSSLFTWSKSKLESNISLIASAILFVFVTAFINDKWAHPFLGFAVGSFIFQYLLDVSFENAPFDLSKKEPIIYLNEHPYIRCSLFIIFFVFTTPFLNEYAMLAGFVCSGLNAIATNDNKIITIKSDKEQEFVDKLEEKEQEQEVIKLKDRIKELTDEKDRGIRAFEVQLKMKEKDIEEIKAQRDAHKSAEEQKIKNLSEKRAEALKKKEQEFVNRLEEKEQEITTRLNEQHQKELARLNELYEGAKKKQIEFSKKLEKTKKELEKMKLEAKLSQSDNAQEKETEQSKENNNNEKPIQRTSSFHDNSTNGAKAGKILPIAIS